MLGTIKKINYNSMASTDFPTFNLIVNCSFDSDNGETSSFLNREAVASERHDGSYQHVHKYKYNERFAPKVTFLKEGFADFEQSEVRTVLSWLTSKSTASFADFYDDIDSNAITFSVLGGWTDIQVYKLSNARVVGIVATFESVHPYALSPMFTVEKTITTPQTFTINCETDEVSSLIYPKVTITQGNSVVVQADSNLGSQFVANVGAPADYVPGTVYQYNGNCWWVGADDKMIMNATNTSGFITTSVIIENLTVKSKTVVGGNVIGEVVTLDGANRVIGSSATRTFGDTFNWQWMPLTEGNNEIKIMGNCTVKIEYREVRKIGEW